MPYNQVKYLAVVQPTSNTEVSFLIGELELDNLKFNRKYVPEDADPDKPFEPVPVRVKVFTQSRNIYRQKIFVSCLERKKRCRTDKLSKIKVSDLILLARRRTRVRRVAKFVRSIKHNFLINFRFPVFLRGSIGLLNLQNPLLYLVLYGLRFFYIPFYGDWCHKAIDISMVL